MSRFAAAFEDVLESVGLKDKDPREMLKEWTREVRREQRGLDRQIREIEREEIKIKRDMKKLAAKGEREALVSLARALVQSRSAKSRILVSKANMNSVLLELRHQVAQLRMMKSLQSSTKLMAHMNKLRSFPQMHQLAYEMEKAGLIQEVMDDALEGVTETYDDEVDEQVDKILEEFAVNRMDQVPAAPTGPVREQLAESGKRLFQASIQEERVLVGAEEDTDTLDFERRLAALQH
mmetsp:Transcript_1725/g.2714  ORF Transcript_1725/g.2714 Transcript_1725/m.2714 type:complete len:236 (+) Transcript_1725:360-1067(+)